MCLLSCYAVNVVFQLSAICLLSCYAMNVVFPTPSDVIVEVIYFASYVCEFFSPTHSDVLPVSNGDSLVTNMVLFVVDNH